jgi:hypothetical protein
MVALKTHVEDPDVGTRFVVWIGRHTPGAEAPFFNRVERPKIKALGYPEAKCKDNSRSPFGDDNEKNESSGKGKGGTADPPLRCGMTTKEAQRQERTQRFQGMA